MDEKKTLKELRLLKSFSIRDLAIAAGVSPTSVQSLEAGKRATLRTKRLIASALGVEPASINW